MSEEAKTLLNKCLACISERKTVHFYQPKRHEDFTKIIRHYQLDQQIQRHLDWLDITEDYILFQIDCYLAKPFKFMDYLENITFDNLSKNPYHLEMYQQIMQKKKELNKMVLEQKDIQEQLKQVPSPNNRRLLPKMPLSDF